MLAKETVVTALLLGVVQPIDFLWKTKGISPFDYGRESGVIKRIGLRRMFAGYGLGLGVFVFNRYITHFLCKRLETGRKKEGVELKKKALQISTVLLSLPLAIIR